MQKATAASATPALAAAQHALRHVRKVDSPAGHNKSGAGMLQAEQDKDKLQETRAAGSTRATEIIDQSRSSQKSPKQTMRNECKVQHHQDSKGH